MKKIICAFLVVVLSLSLCACDMFDYEKAMARYYDGDLESARRIFIRLDDYKDSRTMVKVCDYEIACELMGKEEYAQAAERFASLDGYKDSVDKAKECYTIHFDNLLQGDWSDVVEGIIIKTSFKNGRYTMWATKDNKTIQFEGSYRIDIESERVIVCHDYYITGDSMVPITEKEELNAYTFTYDGVKIDLTPYV